MEDFFFFLKTANKESKPEQVVYWEAFVKFRLATSSSKKTAKKKEKKKKIISCVTAT